MVVIQIKESDGEGFLFETTTSTANDDLIESLVELQNLRLRSKVIADSVRGLAQYGIMKVPTDVGDDEIQEKCNHQKIEKGPNYKPDPTGARTGNAPDDEKLVQTLLQTAQDLEEYIDKAQVQRRIALKSSVILDKIANVRGAVIMAYPMGLPEYDLVKISLDSENLDATYAANQQLDPKNTRLWCAGKQFPRGPNKKVSDRLGTNEKTKVIAKLQSGESQTAPSREPIVNEEERKAMMAHYFKRQEEMKRLAEANDDDYLNSSWADTKEMKRSLQGLGSIKAPGLRFS